MGKNQPYQCIFENTPDAIIILQLSTDGPCKVLDCNQAACRMMGMTKEALITIGIDLCHQWTFDGDDLRDLTDSIRKGECHHFTGEFLRDDLARVRFEAFINVVQVDEEECFAAFVRDIGDHIQPPLSVNGRNFTYNGLLELLPDFICEINADLKVKYINHTGVIALGYHEEDLHRGVSPFERVHPEDLKRAKETILKLLNGGEYKGPNQYRMVLKDGVERTFLIRSVPRFERSKCSGILCCMTDITEQKSAETALRESEKKYRALFESSPDAVLLVEIREDGYFLPIVDCNRVTCVMNGYRREDLIGQDIDLINEESAGLEERLLYLNHLRRDKFMLWEEKHRRKNGEVFPVEIRAHHLVMGGKEYVLSIDRDITRQRQTLDALRESETKYRALFDRSMEGIILVDISDMNNWLIADCNEAFCNMNDYSRDELIGQPLDILHSMPTPLEQKEQRLLLLREEKYSIEENIRQRKDGSKFLIESTSCLISIGGKEYILAIDRDIDERKKAEEALRESEAKYRALFNNMVDGIFLTEADPDNPDEVILDCNEAACRMNGYTREELVGQSVSIFNPSDDSIEDKRRNMEEIYARKTITHEFVHERKDGSILPIESTATLITIGKKNYILGIDRDVSQRKQAEQALRDSEAKYHVLFDNLMEGIFLVQADIDNPDGIIIDCNEAAGEMNGYTREEIIGKPVSIFNPFNYRIEEKRAYMEELLQAGKLTREFNHYRKDGTRYMIENTSSLIMIDGKRYVLGIDRDISLRKKVEADLAAEKERLSVTLGSIGEGVIATDLEGHVVLINKAAEDLTGWSAKEAIGRPISEVFCTKNVSGLALAGPISDLAEDIVLIANDGGERIIEENGATIRDGQGNAEGMVTVFRDITRQKKNEQELLKTQKLESLGILAGGIAHDFNNILTSVLLNIQLSKMLFTKGIDISKHLTDLEKAITRATNLTAQLLTFAKGGAPIKKRRYVNDLIRDTVEFALRGSRSMYRFQIANDLAPVEVDEGQLSQVINNLVINADQAMENGGMITVGAENVELVADNALPLKLGAYIRLYVSDLGKGIPKSHLQKIFDPYFTTKQGGNGLGLASSFSIIKGHHGYIDVESSEGQGATFSIYLPAAKEGAVEPKQDISKPSYSGGRVLLMDDDDAIRLVTEEALRQYGFDVEVFNNGEDTIKRYKSAKAEGDPFNAVILDLTIPGGIGGEEVLGELLPFDPAIKAIVASGYSNSPVMSDYRHYGFSGVVTKPYHIDDLVRILNTVIGSEDR